MEGAAVAGAGGEATPGRPPLRRSVSAEGLHRLLGRVPSASQAGINTAQRAKLLARLGRPRPHPAASLDAVLQQSAEGLEMGRLLTERDALLALAQPCGSADATQFAAELGALEDGASVAVVTLLGSLNPITLG